MFSKVLVKLTSIFLFCMSATSATPSTEQPGEAHNINGDIHARANAPYLCEDPFVWLLRECVGAISPTAWQDVCRWNSFVVIYDYKPGNCPAGTTCLDRIDSLGHFIDCISDETGEPIGKGKSDPQAGTSDVKSGRTQLGNTQQQFSVKVDHDMTDASVAAVFKSECRTFNKKIFLFNVGNELNLGVDDKFLIAPNNVIVGNVHGYRENVCRGDKSKPTMARECYPLGKYNFKAGQTIDFTWGMTGDQEGKLVYGIIPA